MSRAVWLAPSLAAFLVTGCGSTSATPVQTLSHGRFVYLANHACAQANRQNHKLNKLPFQRRANMAFASYEKMVVAFRRLTPPPVDQDRFQALLQALDREDLVIHNLVNAIVGGERGRAKALVKQGDRAGKRIQTLAAALGLRVCAKP